MIEVLLERVLADVAGPGASDRRCRVILCEIDITAAREDAACYSKLIESGVYEAGEGQPQ